MGTFNANILPTTTGLSLGSSLQQWNANLNKVSTASLNNKVYANAGETVASAVARLLALNSNGGIVYFDQGVYPSGSVNITSANVMLCGAGMPGFNSTTNPTALVGGTIIQGTVAVSTGADRFSCRDLGIDVGPTYINANNGGIALDGLSIANPGQVVGAAQIQSPVIMNVSVLGFSATAAFHAILVENVNNAYVQNVSTCLNQHGLVIKGTNVTVCGVWARGHGIDSIIVKYDNYAVSGAVNISNFSISSLVAGDTKGMYLLGNFAPLVDVNVSNGNVLTYSSWAIQCQNCTGVNISNVTIDNAGNNVVGMYGLQFTTATSLVNVSNCNIQNVWAGSAPNSPTPGSYQDYNFTNCHFTNITTNAIEAYGRTTISNCTFVAVTVDAILNDSSTTAVSNNIFASVGTQYAGAGSFSFGGMGTMDTSSNITFPSNVGSTSGVFFSGATVVIAALATPVALPTTTGLSGIIVVRDNTLGGMAMFGIDPNGGSQLIGLSQITGLAAAQVTYSSGWRLALSAGATPRTLAWTTYCS